MARRSANAGPTFIPSGPAARQQRHIHDPNESAFSKFVREQILAPEKLPGNLSILTGVGMFVGGILAVRRWGDLMIPA